MGDFDGVGRIYRIEPQPQPERHPQLERTERDKRGKGQDSGHHEEEPHDTVELHDEPTSPSKKTERPRPRDHKLDISA